MRSVTPAAMRRRVLGGVLLVAAGACGGGQPPAGPEPEPGPALPEIGRVPPPSPGEPSPVGEPRLPPGAGPPDTVVSNLDVRVGLMVGTGPVEVGGGDPVILSDPAGNEVARLAGGRAARLTPRSGAVGLALPGGDAPVEEMVVFRPLVPGRFVRVAGRDYRGEIWVFRDRTGLTVVNRLGLESYLAGVVPVEIGARRADEDEAVKAQAVVSRTFAVRNRGRWRREGFDFYPTVADQAYGGVGAESARAWAAVRATRGTVITYRRAPIDAFFFSTCGGETAEGTEVYRNARRPYLRSIHDRDSRGQPYCRISPRFTWREHWSGSQLNRILRRTLPAQAGVAVGAAGRLRNLEIIDRTGSRRVDRIVVEYERSNVTVDGPAIRRVLERPSGGLLRSTAFDLTVERHEGEVSSVIAEGHGAGHGVGMCQWGAIGRARAGQGYARILQAYFPGTTLEQLP